MPDTSSEVRQAVQAFAECWNRHDMAAFARLFARDAEFVNVVGLWWKGRDEIRLAHERTHATLFSRSRLTFEATDVRFPAAGVALARTTWLLQGHVDPDGAALPDRRGLLLNVLAATDAGWIIVDSQNTDIVEGVLSRPQQR